MTFILNRREKLRASAIPPEIPDGSTLVKKTDKASASKLGLVKIGDNVNISSAGAISVPVGSDETAGVYKVGSGLSVDENGVLSATGGGGGVPTFTQLFNGDADFGTANTTASLNADYDTFDAIYCIFQNAVSKNISPFFMFTQFIPEPGETGTNRVISTGVSSSASNGIAEGAFWFTDKRTMKCGPSGPSVHLLKVYGVTF